MMIERATRNDLPRILAIQKEAYLSEAAFYGDYSLPQLHESLGDIEREFETKVILKAEVDGVIVGSVRVILSGLTCLVGRLIVDPRYQRRGIGTALLSQAESVFPQAVEFELFTGWKSEANVRLYGRHGYVRIRDEVVSEKISLTYMLKRKLPIEVPLPPSGSITLPAGAPVPPPPGAVGL
jgi:GNAT superfamily N-acetyltransferase